MLEPKSRICKWILSVNIHYSVNSEFFTQHRPVRGQPVSLRALREGGKQDKPSAVAGAPGRLEIQGTPCQPAPGRRVTPQRYALTLLAHALDQARLGCRSPNPAQAQQRAHGLQDRSVILQDADGLRWVYARDGLPPSFLPGAGSRFAVAAPRANHIGPLFR
jgi:hypothetical protein